MSYFFKTIRNGLQEAIEMENNAIYRELTGRSKRFKILWETIWQLKQLQKSIEDFEYYDEFKDDFINIHDAVTGGLNTAHFELGEMIWKEMDKL